MEKYIILGALVVSALVHLTQIILTLIKAAQQGVQADATPTSAVDSESNNGVRR